MDGQTDKTTYCGITVLCIASRGKNGKGGSGHEHSGSQLVWSNMGDTLNLHKFLA